MRWWLMVDKRVFTFSCKRIDTFVRLAVHGILNIHLQHYISNENSLLELEFTTTITANLESEIDIVVDHMDTWNNNISI